MSEVRLVDLVKPFAPFIPEVDAPERKVAFNQRVMWTCITLLIFLVMSEIPLYGITSSDSSDPLMWLRLMLASNRGTLMELGVSPIITSSMLFQFLTATQVISVNMEDKRERNLFQAAQKALAFVVALGQAIVYVFSGMYGPSKELGIAVCLLLILQLVFASIVVILLDEVLQKGYGLGSGISLFTATSICQQVFWKAFSPTTVNTGRGTEFEGALVALVHLLSTKRDKKEALIEAFFRTNLPNIVQVLATVLVFFVVIYLQDFRVELPVKSTKMRGPHGSFPVKLFYTSNTPIMLQAALTSNALAVSRILFTRLPNNLLVRLFGTWETAGDSRMSCVSGIVYYLQSPQSFTEALLDPIRLVVYVAFTMVSCAAFSSTWIEISGSSPRDVAKQFKEQSLVITGHRETSVYNQLKKVIPTAAAFGGAAIGALSVVSDLLGTLGSGSSILLATTTIYSYYEIGIKEGGFSKSVLDKLN